MIEDVYHRDREKLEAAIGAVLGYGDLCSLAGEEKKGGDSKKAQIKRIERYVRLERPSSRTFTIGEVYPVPLEKIDGRKGNGGARKNAGRSQVMEEEFEYLLVGFIAEWQGRMFYNCEPSRNIIYFTTKEAYEYFGVCAEDFYTQFRALRSEAKEIEYPELREEALDRLENGRKFVMSKLRERLNTLVLDKMRRVPGLTLESGILAYKKGSMEIKEAKETTTRPPAPPEKRDDLLDAYNKYEEEFVKSHGMKNLGDVIDADLWGEMSDFISSKFPDYEKVIKVKKLVTPTGREASTDANLKRYTSGFVDLDDIESCKEEVNDFVVGSLHDYFLGKLDEPALYLTIIDRCVAIEPKTREETSAKFLKDNPEYAEEIERMLGCRREALLQHVDWLGVPPEELLSRIASMPVTPSQRNYRKGSRYGSYWKALKKSLHDKKQKDFFVADESDVSDADRNEQKAA